jgi:hypothetical protein
MSFRLLGVLGLGVVAACSGKPEAKAPTTPPVATGSVEVMEELPDLSPVARPTEVVLVGRVSRPRQLVETLARWGNVPLKLEDMLPPEARTFAEAVLWEAPVDTVVALDALGEGKVPPPLVIGSLGLKSLEEGLRTAERMQLQTRRVAPGVYRVVELDGASCALARSLGTAPARLVCGRTARDVDALLPYAIRGLAAEAQGASELEVTLITKPLQDRFGQDVGALRLFAGAAVREAALDVPRFDRALSDAVYGGIDEAIALFGDLEQLRVEARIDTAKNALLGSAELRLEGQASWTAGTIAATQPRAVPAVLPRIVPGATLASYAPPLPAERFAALGRVVGELGEGFLQHAELPEPARKKARRAWDAWFINLPGSFAFVVPPSPADGLAHLHADTTVSRMDEPAQRLLGSFNDVFALIGDPAVKRWAKRKYAFSEKAWPETRKKAIRLSGFDAPATVFEASLDLKALAEVEPSLASALKGAISPLATDRPSRLVVMVQPDGDATYVVSGDDVKEMTRVMAEHKKSEPGERFTTPASADKVALAGYMTLRAVSRYVDRITGQGELGKALAAAPHRGETPFAFAWSVSPGRARADFELPAAVIGDAAVTAVAAAGPLKDALGRTGQ